MKIRTDFVTNSSSSSFILAFDNNDKWQSWEHFEEICKFLRYDELLQLVANLRGCPENCNKGQALRLLYRYYNINVKNDWLKKIDTIPDIDVRHEMREIIRSPKFQDKLDKTIIQNEGYIVKKGKIEDADVVIYGTVWDCYGGLIEWAIRHGFLQENFPDNCIIVSDIG